MAGYSIRRFIHEVRRGWLSVPLFYSLLLAVVYVAYVYLAKLPQAQEVTTAAQLLVSKGSLWDGLSQVWFIFAWGFGVQLLLQLRHVWKRRPREADMGLLLRHGIWISFNAGLFEELIFRTYGFLATIIGLRYLDQVAHGVFQWVATQALLPVTNILTLGLFKRELTGGDWALGAAVILGSLFFRSAHRHYGKLAKANVWFIGMVMFWLLFNYGLIAAILAHFLYDAAVYIAIALTSPLQPRGERKAS